MVEYESSKMNVIKKGDKIEFEKEKEKEMVKVGDKFIVEIAGVMKNEDTKYQKPIYLIKNMDIAVTEEKIDLLEKYKVMEKVKEEIKAGDEIESSEQVEKAVVLWVEADGILCCLQEDQFFTVKEKQKKYWKKTGRHYDEVEKIFQKLKEEEGGIPFL